MKQESGRSLIEIIGVLAIAGVMTVATVAVYNSVRNRQVRTIAKTDLEQIAKNTKLLLEMRGDYAGVSVDYLIKSGALKSNRAPIGSSDWSITSSVDGSKFLINLTGLSTDDCAFFTTAYLGWAIGIRVNGYETDPGAYCLRTGDNQLSFIVQ